MQHQPFLRYVAEDLLAKYGNDLSGVTVVFPNKRASLFLNEHLASLTDKPIWSPRYTTISEMMQQHSAACYSWMNCQNSAEMCLR